VQYIQNRRAASRDFYAIDTQTGDEIWKFEAIGSRYFPNIEFQKTALVKDRIVYIWSRDLNLYALDLKTGRGIWNTQEKDGSWISTTPLVHGDNIYFGTSDTYKFYSLNKDNCREN
jgi:eukaryotic-like serine/threonine-protein kinase